LVPSSAINISLSNIENPGNSVPKKLLGSFGFICIIILNNVPDRFGNDSSLGNALLNVRFSSPMIYKKVELSILLVHFEIACDDNLYAGFMVVNTPMVINKIMIEMIYRLPFLYHR